MKEEDKQFFTTMFQQLDRKVEAKAEEQKAKFDEVGVQLVQYGETMMKMQNDMTTKFSEVTSSVNANVANISANSSAIASTQGGVQGLRQEMSEMRQEMAEMRKDFKEVKYQTNDIQRRVYKNIIVISGQAIPPPTEGEDIIAISMAIVDTLTGVKLGRDTIRNAHRMGSKILTEMLFAGTQSKIGEILHLRHRKRMSLSRTWINIHQNKSDRIVGMVTRKMKKANYVEYYNVNLQGVNEIVKEGVKHKVYSLEDLQKFCPCPVKDLLEANKMDCTADSAVALE